MDIINLTKDLTTKNRVVFNPGLTHYKQDLYILSYRIYKDMKYLNIKEYPTWKEKGHPWKSNWQGINKVGISIVKLPKNNIKKYKIIHNQVLDIEEKPANIISGPEDMRLFKDSNNDIYGLFNMANSESLNFQKSKINRIKGDTRTMYTVKIIINPKTFYIKSSNLKPLCLNHSTGIEKNWSPFVIKNKDYVTNFDFNKSSIHHIYTVKNYSSGICKNNFIKNNVNFFEEIKKKFPTIRFSGGSQSISYNQTQMISIGHIVITIQKQNGSGVSKKKLKVYQSKPKKKIKIKEIKYYYMFFYTFSKNKPFNIKRISNPFQPYTKENYGIFFPTGIVKKGSRFYISYGESDNYVKIFDIKKKDIEKMLKNIKKISLDEYNFVRFLKNGKMKENIILKDNNLKTINYKF